MDLDKELEGFTDYANDDVRALFNRFNSDRDRRWAWFVLTEIMRRFPNLDHYTTGGVDKTYIDIRIGEKTAQEGKPILHMYKESRLVWLGLRSNHNNLIQNSDQKSIASSLSIDAQKLTNWLNNLLIPNNIGSGRKPKSYIGDNNRQSANLYMLEPHPLNTILYGPPGTGKTYHTINKALEVIDYKFYKTHKFDRKALKKRFEELYAENKIVITTFHQSYSYEDFVEGLSADSIDGKIVYGIKDGIFKKISQNANSQHTSNFEEVYTKLCNDIEENGLTLKTLKRNKPIDIEVSTQQNLVVIPQTETKTRMTLTKENLKQRILNGVIGDWPSYTIVIKKYLEDHYHLTTQFQKSNYVLIIDEINRGNISNIFGELITLIEDSKRVGADEALSTTLPYSKDSFSVPSNLYIIGTMNTADRSLTQIDTALRRRFHFEEMMPQPELLDSIVIEGIEVGKLLRCLNARIEALYDREHTLGHAFFMELLVHNKDNIQTLATIFENKIIPLLQEYFFDDWGKIQLILGEQVIKEKPQFSNFATSHINNIVIPKAYDIAIETLKEPDTYIALYKNCLSV
jgi:hypothetical protein